MQGAEAVEEFQLARGSTRDERNWNEFNLHIFRMHKQLGQATRNGILYFAAIKDDEGQKVEKGGVLRAIFSLVENSTTLKHLKGNVSFLIIP